jgi:ribose 1,5-bisphosphokinase
VSGAAHGLGVLVLVVGPSGSGKDTLIGYARDRLADRRIVFCRRIVTRESSAHEAHDVLDEAGYAAGIAAGAFALHWRAHGLGYALPAAVDGWIAEGRVVVANVSRASVPEARKKYSGLRIVWLDAPIAVIAARLAARSRETLAEVTARLERADLIRPSGADVTVLDNSGPIARAGSEFVALLQATAAGSPAPAIGV